MPFGYFVSFSIFLSCFVFILVIWRNTFYIKDNCPSLLFTYLLFLVYFAILSKFKKFKICSFKVYSIFFTLQLPMLVSCYKKSSLQSDQNISSYILFQYPFLCLLFFFVTMLNSFGFCLCESYETNTCFSPPQCLSIFLILIEMPFL